MRQYGHLKRFKGWYQSIEGGMGPRATAVCGAWAVPFVLFGRGERVFTVPVMSIMYECHNIGTPGGSAIVPWQIDPAD